MRNVLLVCVCIIVFSNIVQGQVTVTVTGVAGEDTDSSPRDNSGAIIGPETDNTFETLTRAVDFLMQYSNGGVLILDSLRPVTGQVRITKPLEVIGTPGANTIKGGFLVTNTELTVIGVKFSAPFDTCISLWGNAELVMRDSVLLDSAQGVTSTDFENITVDIEDTTFQRITDVCLQFLVNVGSGAQAVADITVSDCTFSESYMGILEQHGDGPSIYENLIFKNINSFGIYLGYDTSFGPISNAPNVITNCSFESVGLQGVDAIILSGIRDVFISRIAAWKCSGGVQLSDVGDAIIEQSRFLASSRGIFSSFAKVNLFAENLIFKDIDDTAIEIFSVSAWGGTPASNIIRDSTFVSCQLGIRDTHDDGASSYENLSFRDIGATGLEVAWDTSLGPIKNPSTTIRGCVFETAGSYGISLSSVKNVTVSRVEASLCGLAGIGGDGGNTYVVENSMFKDNMGAGIRFQGGVRDVALRRNTVRLNMGGGIRISNCTDVAIEGGSVTGNLATIQVTNGGGISLENVKNAQIGDVEIAENQSSGDGGGIYIKGSDVNISYANLHDNSAEGFGGGVAILATPPNTLAHVTGSTVEKNNAKQSGGGIYLQESLGLITACMVSENSARANGGGVAVFDALRRTSQRYVTEVRANTIVKNTAAADGGGIYVRDSQDVFIVGFPGTKPSQAISNNQAYRNGGGICVESSRVQIGLTDSRSRAPNLITDNLSLNGNGGGIFAKGITVPEYEMNILAGNVIQRNKAEGLSTGDPAMARVGNGGGIAIEDSNRVYLGGDFIGDLKGKLGNGNAATNNGGGIYIFRSTLAIGASTGIGIHEQVRGNVALKGNGGGIAIVESSLAPGNSTLTINHATIQGNKTLSGIPPDTSGYESNVGNGGGIYIARRSSNVVFVPRKGGWRVVVGSEEDPRLFNRGDGNIASANGGGIYIQESNPQLNRVRVLGNISEGGCGGGIAVVGEDNKSEKGYFRACVIQANRADGQPGPGVQPSDSLNGNGGGVAFLKDANAMRIEGCIIGRSMPKELGDQPDRGNVAANNGGGMYAYLSNPELVVSAELRDATTTIVRQNKAVAGCGGGIAVRDESKNAGNRLRIEGLLILENVAEKNHGGGIAILDEGNSVTVEEALIVSNKAQVHGGGIYCRRSNPTIGKKLGVGIFALLGGKVLIEKNIAATGDGGGIACEDDSPNLGAGNPLLIHGAVIISNTSTSGNGGGLAFLNNCNNARIEFNLVGVDGNGMSGGNSAPLGSGGGIYVESSEPVIGGKRIVAAIPLIPFPGLPRNVIAGNKALNGGGVAFSNAAAVLVGNNIGRIDDPALANAATRMGGGIYCDSGAPLIGPIVPPPSPFSFFLTGGNSIMGNKAEIGGGVAFENGAVGGLRWNVITENSVTGGAGSTGGVFVTGKGTAPAITNNTIILNQDDGIRVANGAKPLIQNLILDSNKGFGATAPGYETIEAGGTFGSNNLFANVSGAYGPGTKNLTQPRIVNFANIELNPLYVNRVGKDYRLTVKSPCTPGNSPPKSLLIGALPGPIVDQPTGELVTAPYRDADYGDIDGDGFIDLAVATWSTDFVLVNSGAGVFSSSRPINVPPGGVDKSTAIELGDLDGDGDLDAVIANDGTDILAINSGGTFQNASDRLGSAGISNNVKFADLDGDGNLDILFAKTGPNSFYRGDGAGNFADISSSLGQESADSRDIGIGDLDADGDLDLYVANRGQDNVLLNDGTGQFTAGDLPPASRQSNRVTLGDVDVDGDLDVYIANDDADTLLLNRGDATFRDASVQIPTVDETTRDADFADMNSDGVVDLLVSRLHQTATLLNTGAGWFEEESDQGNPSTDMRWQSDAADTDEDGDLEAVYIKESGIEHFDRFTIYPADSKYVLHIAPQEIRSGEMFTITGTRFMPSQRNVELVYDGKSALGYLANISQISFVVPSDWPEGQQTVELRAGGKLLGSISILIGELPTHVQQWRNH